MAYLRLRLSVTVLLFFSGIFITSNVDAQGASSGKVQPTVEQLQLEIDELRQEIRAMRSNAVTAVAPVERGNPSESNPAAEPLPNASVSSVGPIYALTLGGGKINNPGRYLVLLPPINGATAASGTPYFTENPGDPYKAYDASVTADWMPSQYVTWRIEYNYRAANVAYFSGPGGVTPPEATLERLAPLCLAGHLICGEVSNAQPQQFS